MAPETSPSSSPSSSLGGDISVVPVALEERGYDVLIGPKLLHNAAALIAERLPGARCVVVSDENVAALYLETLENALKAADLHLGSIVVPPGEASKSFAQLQPLCSGLLEASLERGDCVVALGGGVIGDLAGFAAGVVRRGVRLVQIPTSLLAQVDSSVGGKTGINTSEGKNLVGVFHQPSLVLADTDVLSTLPVREMRAGYAEVAKYGLLGDAAFFDWLRANWKQMFGNETAALTKAVEICCQAKAGIVARDEKESGERALLNLGHTFGHALEAWTGYSDKLLHGEGVSIGMVLAMRISEELGHAPEGSAEQARRHLSDVGLPTSINDITRPEDGPQGAEALAAVLTKHMAQDKKVQRGQLTFILARGIGEAFINRDVDADTVEAFLIRQIRDH